MVHTTFIDNRTIGTIRPCLLNFHIYCRLLNFAMLSLHSAQPIFSDWASFNGSNSISGQRETTYLFGALEWAMSFCSSPLHVCISHMYHCSISKSMTVTDVMETIHHLGYWSDIHHCGIQKERDCIGLINKTDVLIESSPEQFLDDKTNMMSFNHLQETGQFYDIEEVYVLFTYLGKPSSASCISQLPLSIWSPKI